MDIHLLTPQGEVLVVQVVDGRVIVPSAPAALPAGPAPAPPPPPEHRSRITKIQL